MEKKLSNSTSPLAGAFATDPQIQAALTEGIELPERFVELARQHGVSEKAMPEVMARSVSIIAHRRRDAAGTFAFGADLAYVASQVNEDSFDEFVVEVYQYSPRHIGNFIRVASELGPWRVGCIKASMLTTQIIKLLARTPDERDEIVERIAAGERITAQKIEDWGKAPTEPTSPLSDGGLKGLRRLAQAKASTGVQSFGSNIGAVLSAIEDAIPEEARKAPEKKSLFSAVRNPARQARGELVNLGLFVTPGSFGDVSPLAFPEGSDWGIVHDVLACLGDDKAWPHRPQLRTWLTGEVMPVLRWAVSGVGPMERVDTDDDVTTSVVRVTSVDDAPSMVPTEGDVVGPDMAIAVADEVDGPEVTEPIAVPHGAADGSPGELLASAGTLPLRKPPAKRAIRARTEDRTEPTSGV